MAHGDETILDNGLLRKEVVIADMSVRGELVEALGAGVAGRVVGGRISSSVACTFETFIGSATKARTKDAPSAGFTMFFSEDDGIVTGQNEAIECKTSVASAGVGFVDLLTGTNP